MNQVKKTDHGLLWSHKSGVQVNKLESRLFEMLIFADILFRGGRLSIALFVHIQQQ